MSKKRTSKSRKKEPDNFWESLFFKFSTKFFLGLIVIMVFLTLAQCTIKSPEAPSWDTQFVVPVVNRTYQMEELVDKIGEDEIGIDSLGNVSFSLTEEIDPMGIDTSNLNTADISYSLSDVLGQISIIPPTFSPILVSLSSITGLATGLPGDSAIVNDMMFTVFNNLPTIDEFSQADIVSGHVDVTISNDLGVSLDTLIIQLYDRQALQAMQVDTIVQTIPSGSNVTDSMVLNGLSLSSYLRFDVAAYTPGGTVYQFSQRSISTSVDFGTAIVISSATAQIPPLPDMILSEKIGLDLGPGERIDSAQLRSGNIIMDITNHTALDATINVSVPSLDLNGVAYSFSQPISAGQTINLNNDLSNYNLIPIDDTVQINVAASIPGSGINQVLVNEADSFSVSASIINLNFNSVSGILPTNDVSFDNVQQELDIPDGFNEISFVTAILTLEVENGVDLPGNLACTLQANNGNLLAITGTIDARGSEVRSLSIITNNNVAEFLNPLPDSITISGAISFGDSNPHTINASDSVFARVNIYAPLHIKVNNAEIDDLDIEREAIDQADIDRITDHVKEVRFVYDIINHLPLGVSAVIMLGPDSAALYTNPALTIDTLQALPAPVDPVTGITIAEQVSSGEILLDSLDIQILKNDTLFIRPLLFLNSSDTSGVLLTGSDYFTIQGRIEVEYKFDGEF